MRIVVLCTFNLIFHLCLPLFISPGFPDCKSFSFLHFHSSYLTFIWQLLTHIPYNLPIKSVQFSGFQYIHRVVQPSPLFLRRFSPRCPLLLGNCHSVYGVQLLSFLLAFHSFCIFEFLLLWLSFFPFLICMQIKFMKKLVNIINIWYSLPALCVIIAPQVERREFKN